MEKVSDWDLQGCNFFYFYNLRYNSQSYTFLMTDSLICSLYGLFCLVGVHNKVRFYKWVTYKFKIFSIEGLDLLSMFQHSCGAFKYRGDIFWTLVPLFMFWKLLLLLLIVHKDLKFMVFSWSFHASSGAVGTIAMLFAHIGMLWTHLHRHCTQLLLLHYASLGAFAWGWRSPKAPVWFETHITIKLIPISPLPWKPSSSGKRKDPGSLGIYTVCLPSCSLLVFTILFPPLIL